MLENIEIYEITECNLPGVWKNGGNKKKIVKLSCMGHAFFADLINAPIMTLRRPHTTK